MAITMKKRILSFLLAVSLLSGIALTSCSTDKDNVKTSSNGGDKTSGDKSGNSVDTPTPAGVNEFPFSAEPIDLKFVRLCWSGEFQDSDQMWKWKDYAKKTNMNVSFDEYPITDYQETLKLKLTTGDLPDAYYQMIFTPEQIFENGQNGNLIPLNDLIDQYAPNIKKLFDSDPSVKKSVTMPDGNIYSLPWVAEDKLDASVRTYVNEGIAKELGMAVPQTIDELTKFMQGMKEKYPESYPLVMPKGNEGIVLDAFSGAWGLGNAGMQGMTMHTDLGPDGKVRFYKSTDEYKAMLKQFADWYKQGLVHPELFTTMDVAKWQNLGSKNQVGVFSWVSPSYVGNEDVYNNFKGVSQFKGPNGDQVMSWVDAAVRGTWSFMITKENKYPIETIKWVDYWYSKEAAIYTQIGVEGETYAKNADGKYEFIGEAKKAYDDGKKQYKVLGHYGGFEPGIAGMDFTPEEKKMIEDITNPEGIRKEDQFRVDDLKDYEKYIPSDIWPLFVANDDEAEELSVIASELTTYLNEMRDKFITGALDIDKEWDRYLKDLEKINVKKYTEIRQAQYDRYKAS